MKRLKMVLILTGLAFFVISAMLQLPAAAQTTEEFVRALSPDSTQPAVRKRGVGGIHTKTGSPQKAMHLNFDLNSATLTDSAKNTLDQLGEALLREELRKYIYCLEGHTCDRGSDAHNMDLSKRRATTVHQYLTRNFGLSSHQLEVVWLGESQPAVPNNDETARQKNRRVVIVNTLKPIAMAGQEKEGRLLIRRLRDGREMVIADGEVMNQHDSYAIEFKTHSDPYVYIFQKDSSGQLTQIFPNTKVVGLNNPLQPNAFYRMPGPGKWFFLDEHKGTEEILMVTHVKPLEDPLAVVQEVVAGNLDKAKMRGLGGIHRKQPPQKTAPVVSQKPATAKIDKAWSDPELHVFKRYFVHE